VIQFTIPEATFQDMVARNLVQTVPSNPENFFITPEGQGIINALIGH
jgi:hypothetical protein